MEWSPQQHAALEAVRRWLTAPHDKPIFRLFGYAGTGKTTLAIEIAKMVPGRVLFASFTGKAALVMSRKGCTGASTIHSLIYSFEDEDEDDDSGSDELRFRLNPNSELAGADLLIIDECSMVDEQLGRDVMSFGTPVLVLGDPAQLPPVAGGGYFTETEPDVMLTEIHRQAADNPIIRLATALRQGEGFVTGHWQGSRKGTGVSVVVRESLKETSMLAADQILCGKNDTRATLNRKIRAALRERGALPRALVDDVQSLPVVGDRIICLKNNRKRGLLNGGMWRINEISDRSFGSTKRGRPNVSYLDIRSDDVPGMPCHVKVPKVFWDWNGKDKLELDDDLGRRSNWDEFAFAYAVTCHKSQGSQWDKVVIYDEASVFNRGDDGPDIMRRWRYTATTRAAEALIVAV